MKCVGTLQQCRYMQFLCVLIVTLLEASSGMFTTWLSPILPQLTDPDAPLGVTLTEDDISWLVASEKIGDILGCLIATYFTDLVGRKVVLLFAAIPILVSWILLAVFVIHPGVLISARILGGIGGGCSFVVISMYIGEVSEKDARGSLVTLQSVLSVMGNVIVLIVGPFVNYYDLILLCGIFPAIYLVLFFFMPETPFFLVKIGNIDAARQTVQRLWQRNADPLMIEDKIEAIKASVAHDMENKANLWEMFSNKVYRKPLLITLGLRTVLVCSGIFVMGSYLQTIIESSHSIISPEISSIIFGTIQIPSVILASVLVDKIGRRPLLIISSIGSALTLTAEGVYFYLQDHTEADINKISWLPTTSMALYLLLVYFGIYVLPGVVMSELFAINMKTSSCAFISIYGALLGFIVSKSFQPVSTKLGKHAPFWIFASVCFLGSFFGFFILPETKGKSFLEIQQMLNKNKNLLPRAQSVENN